MNSRIPIVHRSEISNSRVSASGIQLTAILGLLLVFLWSFFSESIATNYIPSLYITNATLYGRALFWLVMLVFFMARLISRQRIPKISAFFFFVVVTYSLLGLIASLAHQNTSAGILSHLSHYFGALICILSASMIKFSNVGRFWGSARVFSYAIIFISLAIYILIYSSLTTAIHISLTISALSWPFIYGLQKRKKLIFWGSTFMIFASLKRGLWLAALAMILFASSKRQILLSVAITAFVALFLINNFSDTTLGIIVLNKFNFGAGVGFDEISSGRVSVLLSVNSALAENDAILTGLGFGATFIANSQLPSATNDWVTNGVDVVFGHFWLLHGYVAGTVLFLLYSAAFLAPAIWNRTYKDSVLGFFSAMSIFSYIMSLSTFIFWDPFPWVVIGLAIARRQHLLRHVHMIGDDNWIDAEPYVRATKERK